MNKKIGFGCAFTAALFAVSFAFWGCDNPSGDNGTNPNVHVPSYTVKVEPGSAAVMQGRTMQFAATLQEDGQDVSGSYNTTWAVSGTGAAINAGGNLRVNAGSGPFTVTATITYSGNTYTGTASVTVASQSETVTALRAVYSAATVYTTTADSLFNALKESNTGLNVSLVLAANKNAYFLGKSEIASCLYSINGLMGNLTTSDIFEAIDDLNTLLQSINYTAATSSILTEFNSAAGIAEIQALLTEQNIRTLLSGYSGVAGILEIFNAIANKTSVAQTILQSRQSNTTSQFADGQSVGQAVLAAIQSQQQTEAAILTSSFSNKPATQITPLLTQNNFIILNVSAENWTAYNNLDTASKEQFASKLANKTFSTSNPLSSAIVTALQETIIWANVGQIKQKINAAIDASATTADVNGLLEFVAPLFGVTLSESDKLNNDKLSLYNSFVSQAKLGNYSLSAIRAYGYAGANPTTDQIMEAFDEILELIGWANTGRSFLTLNNGLTSISSLSVTVYDALSLPTSQSALSSLPPAASGNFSSSPSTSVTIGLQWNGSIIDRARSFVVKATDNYGSINKVGLVQFDTNGNASAYLSSFTNVSDLGTSVVTISFNTPPSLNSLSVTVYDSTTLPTSSAALSSLMSVASGNLSSFSGSNTETVRVTWQPSFTASRSRSFVVRVSGYTSSFSSINKIGLGQFNTAGNATINWNAGLLDTALLGTGITIQNLYSSNVQVTVYNTSSVPTTQIGYFTLSNTGTLMSGSGSTRSSNYIAWTSGNQPNNSGTYVVAITTPSSTPSITKVGSASFSGGNATIDWNNMTDVTTLPMTL